MSFDNLYVSKIHYLRKNGKIPSHGVSKPAALSFFKHDEMIIALMVVVAKNPTQREIKHEKVVSLSRALNDMPVQLRVGTLSWLVLPGEEEPSSLIIHTHLSQEELARLAQFRLMEITRGKMHTNRFNFLNFGKSDVVRKIVEEAREQANQSTLVDSEAVVSYLKWISICDISFQVYKKDYSNSSNLYFIINAYSIISNSTNFNYTYLKL